LKCVNALAPARRPFLGAEELLELGQGGLPAVRPSTAETILGPRTVTLSRDEGELLVRVTENIVAFAQGFPIEFHSYCPTDRWQETLKQVGTWSHEIERQLDAGAQSVAVPAEAVLRLVDIEKCVSAARDARIGSAKTAFVLAAGGAIADIVFGLTWLGVPAYVAGLAVLFGRPLMAKLRPEPQEPYKPSIRGAFLSGRVAVEMGCPDAPKVPQKVLERVIVGASVQVQKHHWGEVLPARGPNQSAVCLAKDRFRVRIEGRTGDRVIPGPGWDIAPIKDCEDAPIQIAVWQPCESPPRRTSYGPIPETSGHEETYWVEYVGPFTKGTCRRAGPFG